MGAVCLVGGTGYDLPRRGGRFKVKESPFHAVPSEGTVFGMWSVFVIPERGAAYTVPSSV